MEIKAQKVTRVLELALKPGSLLQHALWGPALTPDFLLLRTQLLPWGPECRVEILRAEFYTDMETWLSCVPGEVRGDFPSGPGMIVCLA